MTYFFETYGCEMNIAESASMEQLLIARGWTKSESAQTADLIVINTCSIRKTAEDRIEGRLGWINGLKAVREKKTNAKTKFLEEAVDYVKDGAKPLTVVVTGCMAERLLPTFKERWPFVDFVVGTYAKHHFGKIIEAVEEGRVGQGEVVSVPDDSGAYQFAAVSAEPGAFSTFVPIMHGCNNFCTYCIVPYVRGREISRPVEQILQELDFLKKHKVCEITLIGQNVNSYQGQGFDGATVNFAGLLRIIAEHLRKIESTIRWVRFMSSHPKDFTDDVINVISEEKVLCRHIHLPVQNGSNNVLKAMNRRYTREQYLELVAKIKAKIPEVSLTTDIMMGFPGETEEDVEQTLDLMKQVKYESAMMYYYNQREGTPAAKMEQIPEEIRKQRLQRVIDLQLEHTHERMIERIGKKALVIVEGVSRDNPDELLAQTEQHEKLVFKGEKSLIGSFVQVIIKSLNGNTFRGELLS
ncbi:MAG: tRNA (N6-isopentenyl adenosine(37)-C2)-methylthiotransferase MiaB [Treponema sp.]|nr:tRNA (N6-isopentenyl adenosine(37)-C2)-methylthiotransferase MiaB [Treponema sp.]